MKTHLLYRHLNTLLYSNYVIFLSSPEGELSHISGLYLFASRMYKYDLRMNSLEELAKLLTVHADK